MRVSPLASSVIFDATVFSPANTPVHPHLQAGSLRSSHRRPPSPPRRRRRLLVPMSTSRRCRLLVATTGSRRHRPPPSPLGSSRKPPSPPHRSRTSVRQICCDICSPLRQELPNPDLHPPLFHYWKRVLCREPEALPRTKSRALSKDILCRGLCRGPVPRQRRLGKVSPFGHGDQGAVRLCQRLPIRPSAKFFLKKNQCSDPIFFITSLCRGPPLLRAPCLALSKASFAEGLRYDPRQRFFF